MTTYNKLVRDKIPEILDKKGVSYEMRIAQGNEFKEELIKKFAEEVSEFIEDPTVEEFADVLEVVETLKKLSEYKKAEDVRVKKREEKGGFDRKIILKGNKK